jgi:hypothetical protein
VCEDETSVGDSDFAPLDVFLGAPLAAVIMFVYMAICLIDLIAFGMRGGVFPSFCFF